MDKIIAGGTVAISDETRARQREKISNRSVSSMENKFAQANREALEEAEASMAPPVINEPRCFVCQSERRLWIERQLLKGRSYSAIANSLPPEKIGNDQRSIDRRSIANHSQHHMPLDQAVIRAVLEEEADLLGQNWEEGVKGAVTTRGMFNVMMRKAFEDAMGGVTTIEPRDFIQMAKVYNEMVSSEGAMATEEAKTAVLVFMEAIQNVLADELDYDLAETIKTAIVDEVKRLRSRDDIEVELERNLKAIPSGV